MGDDIREEGFNAGRLAVMFNLSDDTRIQLAGDYEDRNESPQYDIGVSKYGFSTDISLTADSWMQFVTSESSGLGLGQDKVAGLDGLVDQFPAGFAFGFTGERQSAVGELIRISRPL